MPLMIALTKSMACLKLVSPILPESSRTNTISLLQPRIEYLCINIHISPLYRQPNVNK